MSTPALLLAVLIESRLFGLADQERDVQNALRAQGVNICFASDMEGKTDATT